MLPPRPQRRDDRNNPRAQRLRLAGGQGDRVYPDVLGPDFELLTAGRVPVSSAAEIAAWGCLLQCCAIRSTSATVKKTSRLLFAATDSILNPWFSGISRRRQAMVNPFLAQASDRLIVAGA